jgi:hypothetical protein
VDITRRAWSWLMSACHVEHLSLLLFTAPATSLAHQSTIVVFQITVSMGALSYSRDEMKLNAWYLPNKTRQRHYCCWRAWSNCWYIIRQVCMACSQNSCLLSSPPALMISLSTFDSYRDKPYITLFTNTWVDKIRRGQSSYDTIAREESNASLPSICFPSIWTYQ